MRNNNKKECIICHDPFEIKSSGYHEKIKSKRGRNTITCSRKCAKIYRIHRRLYLSGAAYSYGRNTQNNNSEAAKAAMA